MPELPEVEVTARALRPVLAGQRLLAWHSSGLALRYPMPARELDQLVGQTLQTVERRAKFLLLQFSSGWLVIHLGMSGACRFAPPEEPARLHDHLMLAFGPRKVTMVLNDPRRFGSVQWVPANAAADMHALGACLGESAAGLEPFSPAFTGAYLRRAAVGKKISIKQWLMQGSTVVGVGNIYACEALFAAGIHPARPAGRISQARLTPLAMRIQTILANAIEQGGSTLRDFHSADGSPGRYGQSHQVYGRAGQPCAICGTPIRRMIQNQRSTFYCHVCQR
jgi:formamidopyrimidine-DNA glycosylase